MSFSDTLKHLDVVPARRATIDEVCCPGNDKGHLVYPTRAIKKINKHLILPAHIVELVDSMSPLYCIEFQYTFVAPQAFRILNANTPSLSEGLENCSLCVRWRVGTVAYKYMIAIPSVLNWYGYPAAEVTYAPLYTNELIQPNCVFEVIHAYGYNGLGFGIGLRQDVELVTSLMANPSTPDELSIILDTPTTLDHDDIELGVVPFNIPADNTVEAFEDNP